MLHCFALSVLMIDCHLNLCPVSSVECRVPSEALLSRPCTRGNVQHEDQPRHLWHVTACTWKLGIPWQGSSLGTANNMFDLKENGSVAISAKLSFGRSQ